jgi:glycosyltransferase involved in cell wall biosynthesis
MKILFLALDVNIKSKTGDAVHVRELASSLAEIGNEVSLVAPHVEGEPDQLSSLKRQANLHLYFNKPKGLFRDLSTVSFCKKIAKSQGCEVIYERRFTPKISYALNKTIKLPFAVEINGLRDKEMELQNIKGKSGLIPKGLKRRIWRHFFKSAGKVVVVSYGLKKGLSEEYYIPQEKIQVIFNGANTELFKPLNINKCKEELNLDLDLRYLGFIGNLAPWQGVEQIIKIAPEILNRFPKARFVMVGDGFLRSQLVRMAEKSGVKDKIIFTGFVPYESVPKYINSFEICLAPFSGIERNVRYSFSAIKLYEYMACEKAVITTDVCGIKKEIAEQGLGRVVKADDIPALIASTIELMEDRALRESMGGNARRWVLDEHSWKNVAERVAGVCNEIALAG